MDPFPEGAFVRLRNRVRDDTYLYADEDGVGVSLRRRDSAPSLNAVWRVHRATPPGCTNSYVLLRGAAYGRYLAMAPERASPGHRGSRAVQRDYGDPRLEAVLWTGVREAGYVRLSYNFDLSLRANGRHRFWLTGVTVDSVWPVPTTMMHWTVEVVPPTQVPPALPLPTPDHRRGLLWRLTGPKADEQRTIRHVRANEQGGFNSSLDDWPSFTFHGRSVFNLRTEVGIRQNVGDILGVTICVRPGFCGRLTPLIADLPRSEEAMDIVVLTNGSPAAERLVYPDI